MNGFGKLLTGVGLFVGGYLVGFYELKYKMYKAVAEVVVEKGNKEQKEESQQ